MLNRRTLAKESQKISAQSSSALLGLALPPLLAQGALVCQSNALTGFGWALFGALSGCLVSTLLNWSTLINTLLPERSTWKSAVIAGFFVALGLYLQGLALSSPQWTAVNALSIVFIPWSRDMWRSVMGAEPLFGSRSRIASLLMICAGVVFIWPELVTFFQSMQLNSNRHQLQSGFGLFQYSLPRCFSFLAALAFGAASGLQRAQDRSISSSTFWTIPTAIAAIILSFSGWLALQFFDERSLLIGQLNGIQNRFQETIPAFLFGVLLLSIRPHVHIKNSLRIGRDHNLWWQTLGLSSGTAITILLSSVFTLELHDLFSFVLILLGQFVGLRMRQNTVTFAPTLSLVSLSQSESSGLTSRQSP